MLDLPFQVQVTEDHPYLESSRASLGKHEMEVYVLDDGDRKTLRVLLDGSPIYTAGDAMPAAAWFKLCDEGGYSPLLDWDQDPVTILFHAVLPEMAEKWTEFPLPYGERGFPKGVVSLATLQDLHLAFVARLADGLSGPAASQAAGVLARLPLRAVVLHDRTEQRVDYLGNALDEAYIGIDLVLGSERGKETRIGKVSLSSTGGMRWSPWLLGGRWANNGREFAAGQTAWDFLRASGLQEEPQEGFESAFGLLIQDYAKAMDEAVERYRAAYPAAIPWHHDLANQYLHHSVVEATALGHGLTLTFDNGLKAVVENPAYLTATSVPQEGQEAVLDPAAVQAVE
jgi:hypothetical protein